MPNIGLWDLFVGPPSGLNTGTSHFENGLAFQTSATITVTGLKFYALSASDATKKPDSLRLWDGLTHQLITSVNTPASWSLGWNTVNLGSAVNLQTNYPYVVSGKFGPNGQTAIVGVTPALSAPLSWVDPPNRTTAANNGGTYPSASFGANYPFVDIAGTTGTVTPPSGGAPTYGDLSNSLASWLSETDATHRVGDGIPWDTWVGVVDLLGRTAIPGTPAGTSLGGIAAWIWANRDQILWAYNQLRSHFAATPDPTYPEIDTNVLTLLGRTGTLVSDSTLIMAALTNIQADLAKLLTPPAPASWVLQDETDFDTSLAWNVPADVYTVSFSDLGSGSVNTVIGGSVDVSYQLAWWSPWNGVSARDRRFCDFPEGQLYDGGVRMPGLVLFSKQGAQGHIQAWTFS